MEKKKIIVFAIYTIVLIIVAGFAGYTIANSRNAAKIGDADAQTFYATIVETGTDGIDVQGMEVNDVNHRAEFFIYVGDETEITMCGETVSFDTLKAGMHVSVTYDGVIMETYPVQIPNALKIQILDDAI